MPSSRPAPNARRQMFLKVSGQIEGQLRDAYAKQHAAGAINQAGLAAKLGVNRSVIHHRLTGRKNMTEETIADMVWGLGYDIDIKIFDPAVTTATPKPIVANTTEAKQVAVTTVTKPFLVPAS